MTEYKIILDKLTGKKPVSTGGYLANCPAHDDQRQSLSINEVDGKILAYCHAGCPFDKVIAKLGVRQIDPVEPQIQTIYDYTDIDGNLIYQVVRYVPKSFKHRRPDGKGDWYWDMRGVKHTLYRLPELAQALKECRPVFVCEGEKDADRLKELGQVATSISGGANSKWPSTLIPLFDNATVYIIPDKDEPGRKYAEYVASILHGWTQILKIVELPCKDAYDYLTNHTIDDLYSIVVNSPTYRASNVVTRDEFEAWKGVNKWLFKQNISLLEQLVVYKKNVKKGLYDSV